jgi:hypothetical protein
MEKNLLRGYPETCPRENQGCLMHIPAWRDQGGAPHLSLDGFE